MSELWGWKEQQMPSGFESGLVIEVEVEIYLDGFFFGRWSSIASLYSTIPFEFHLGLFINSTNFNQPIAYTSFLLIQGTLSLSFTIVWINFRLLFSDRMDLQSLQFPPQFTVIFSLFYRISIFHFVWQKCNFKILF